MKPLKQLLLLTGVFALTTALSGCLESADVTFYEPGVYQGASDPLMDSNNAAALESRFQGQMDR